MFLSREWSFKTTLLILVLASFIKSNSAFADSLSVIYKVEIREEIGPGSARKLGKALDEASLANADLVILHLNTYGGMLDAADSMRTRLLNYDIPVIAFIDNNAASAGALISIACNKIYMRSGGSIGAATVVDQTATPLPDKYQSYMRAMMRATAEKRGRDPLIAEAMVDPRTFIPGVNDSGKVLTFTASEAIKNGYCEGMAESVEEVLKSEGINNYRIQTYTPVLLEKIIGFLINPAVSGILLLIMLGGIYFELQTPGVGFPLLAAVTAAVLYFAPLYLEGLAANWEILMAVAGFVLLAVELLILPGFGVAGIAGIIMLISAFTFSLVGNEGFNFELVPPGDLTRALSTVILSFAGAVILSVIIGKRVLKTNRFGKMVLQGSMSAGDGYISTDSSQISLVGSVGIAQTVLRPSGKVTLDGQSYAANAENGFIEAGKKIKVTRFDGLSIWVTETEND